MIIWVFLVRRWMGYSPSVSIDSSRKIWLTNGWRFSRKEASTSPHMFWRSPSFVLVVHWSYICLMAHNFSHGYKSALGQSLHVCILSGGHIQICQRHWFWKEFKNTGPSRQDGCERREEEDYWPCSDSWWNCCDRSGALPWESKDPPVDYERTCKLFNERFLRCERKKAAKLHKAQGFRNRRRMPGAWIVWLKRMGARFSSTFTIHASRSKGHCVGTVTTSCHQCPATC